MAIQTVEGEQKQRAHLWRATVSLVLLALAGIQAAGLVLSVESVAADASSQQECINDATAPIHIRKSEIRHAGKPGVQSMYAQFTNIALPENCEDQFNVLREERFTFLVQNPLHRSRWVPFLGQKLSDNSAVFNVGNDGGFQAVYRTSGGKHDWGLYKCSPGRKITGAKVVIEEVAVDTQTNQPLAHKVFSTPIQKILPRRC